MRPYLRIFKDCSEFFFKSKQSIASSQRPFEVAGVFNTPLLVYVTFLVCRLKVKIFSQRFGYVVIISGDFCLLLPKDKKKGSKKSIFVIKI